MPFDGVRADEQLRPDLLVGQAFTGEARDLSLLRRQLGTRTDRLLAYLLTGRGELSSCSFGEPLRADPGESLVRGDQLYARIPLTVHPAQTFAVAQPHPRAVECDLGPLEPFDGVDEAGVCGLGVGEHGPGRPE